MKYNNSYRYFLCENTSEPIVNYGRIYFKIYIEERQIGAEYILEYIRIILRNNLTEVSRIHLLGRSSVAVQQISGISQ